MLLEASLRFPCGASFRTIVGELVGSSWNIVTGLSVVFVLYSLTYAYTFVGGGLTQQSLDAAFSLQLPRSVTATLFLFVLATVVASSTRWVGYLSAILIASMLMTFIVASGGLIGQSSLSNLLNTGDHQQIGRASCRERV